MKEKIYNFFDNWKKGRKYLKVLFLFFRSEKVGNKLSEKNYSDIFKKC
jgi:hypothetical protein